MSSLCRFLSCLPVLSLVSSLPAAEVCFRAAGDLVLVPVTVTDREGASILGLRRGQFQIMDDSEPRPIVSFERSAAPISFVVVADTSRSMRSMDAARAALRNIVADAGPEDEAALITFADSPQLRFGFTGRMDHFAEELQDKPAGETALIDALLDALKTVRTGRNPRKALVVITDGEDNHSRHTAAELVAASMETEAQIYAVSVNERTLHVLDKREDNLLERVSRESGGFGIQVRDPKLIPEAAERIRNAMRNLYVIGFTPPTHCGPGRWHQIGVRLDAPAERKLCVRAKRAYWRGDVR